MPQESPCYPATHRPSPWRTSVCPPYGDNRERGHGCRLSNLESLAQQIKAEHKAATEAADRMVQHARAAGELLISAKEQLSHGEWLPWLRDNCELSARSAQGYM